MKGQILADFAGARRMATQPNGSAEARGADVSAAAQLRHLQRSLPGLDWLSDKRVTSPPCDMADRETCKAISAHCREHLLRFEQDTEVRTARARRRLQSAPRV